MGEARTQRLSTVEPHTDHAQAPEERRQLKTELDEVQRGFKIVYRYCLYALILLVTGFAVVLFRAFADTDDVNRAFLDLYGGVAYLAFLAWAIGKLRAPPPRPANPATRGGRASCTPGARSGRSCPRCSRRSPAGSTHPPPAPAR